MSSEAVAERRKRAMKILHKRSMDRLVVVQRKNDIEGRRLALVMSELNKKKAVSSFEASKEKRDVSAQLRETRKTSGYSQEGRMDDAPEDSVTTKSAYFSGKNRLSEKKLRRWREIESELQRTTLNEDALQILVPPWYEPTDSHALQTLINLLTLLGFEEKEVQRLIENLREESIEQKSKRPSRVSTTRRNNIDEKLLMNMKSVLSQELDERDAGDSTSNAALLKQINRDEDFRTADDIKELKTSDKKIVSQYMDMMMSFNAKVDGKGKLRRPSTAPTSLNQRSNSLSVSRLMRTNRDDDTNQRISPSSSSDITLSSPSNQTKGLLRKKSKSDLGPRGLERIPEEKRFPNVSRALTSQSTVPDGTNVSLSADNIEEEKKRRPRMSVAFVEGEVSDINRASMSNQGIRDEEILPETNQSQRRRSSAKDEEVSQENNHGQRRRSSSKDGKTSQETDQNQRRRSSARRPSNVNKGLERRASKDRRVSEEDVLGSRSTLREYILKRSREKRKSQNLIDPYPIAKVEDVDDGAESRKAHLIRRSSSFISLLRSLDDGGETNLTKMPQWKRELLMEAPPALQSPDQALEQQVARRRSVRQRDLEQLVKDHETSLTIRREHSRKLKSRIKVFMTLSRINRATKAGREVKEAAQEAAKEAAKAEEEKKMSIPKNRFQARAGMVMNLLKLKSSANSTVNPENDS